MSRPYLIFCFYLRNCGIVSWCW